MYRHFLSVRYFRTRLVNWLAVGGVMVGVAVMIVVWSVMAGFQNKVREVLRGTLSHLLLRPTWAQEPMPFEELEATLKKDPLIKGASPMAMCYVAHPYKAAIAPSAPPAFHFMEAEGIDWDREKEVTNLADYVKAQAEPGASPFKSKEAEWRESKTGMFSVAFLERFLGRRADPKEWLGAVVELMLIREVTLPTGDKDYKGNTYRVIVSAVYDALDQSTDIQRAYFDRETLREMGQIKASYTDVRIAVKDYDRVKAAQAGIAERVPAVEVYTWEELKAPFLKAVNNEKVLLMIVLSFIVVLSGFTILATLTLTVVEKTRDIGVVKALGGTTGGILSIFLRSGLLTGVLGGVLGLGLGLFLTRNLNATIVGLRENFNIDIFPSDIYLFREIPTVLEWPAIFCIVLGSVIVAFLAGLLPALRAARMDPVVALRHE